MAKYEIKHSCGHVSTVNICGTNVNGERERRAAWLESRPCDKCALERRVEQNGKDGLPELSGTPKQIAWALDIRRKMLGEIDKFAGRHPAKPGMEEVAEAVYAAMCEDILAHGEASWFIENDIYDVRGEFSRVARELMSA